MVYCHCCLNSKNKNTSVLRLLLSPNRNRCLVSSYNAIYSLLERERVARRDQITIAEGTSLTAVALRKRKSNHVILLQTETVVSPIDPNQG